MTTLLYIHGGMTFSKREGYLNYLRTKSIDLEQKPFWTQEFLKEAFSDYTLIKPKLPCKENAQYEDWKIVFERYLELIDDDIVLLGFSLGGIFLSKYLSENAVSKSILSVHLVAPPFDNSLEKEELVGGFELGSDLSMLGKCNVHMYFSSDDPVVTLSQMEKYKQKVNAKYHVFDDKNGHFIVEEFEELSINIKNC